jgi:eukaryotic-like serine/threonine-protein kinase
MLSVGSEFALRDSGRSVRVVRFIGEGSQGSVFEAAVGADAEPAALKWYFDASATEAQRRALRELIDRGAPNSRFLWPFELVEQPGERGFGYLMPLRRQSAVSLAELLTGKVDVPFSTVCMLGVELAGSFLDLHSQGLCYRDISFGNIFFDPATGRPAICDNDNVGVDGESESFVLGTKKFMAPEIIAGGQKPSIATDLYSLSVLLFYLLMVGHPLLGAAELEFTTWDEDAERIMLGERPLFVFDPHDDRNRPLPDMHGSVEANWQMYPEFIRDDFVIAFTDGIADPLNKRVRESYWRLDLARLRDSIQRCPSCRKENFWTGAENRVCWSCRTALPAPIRLEIDRRPLVLNEDSVVSAHHLAVNYDYATVVGRVAEHPTNPGRWGLRNESSSSWSVQLPTGSLVVVEPGRSVGLVAGAQIRMGQTDAVLAV